LSVAHKTDFMANLYSRQQQNLLMS